jgi:nickel-dependent lactate racemase
MTRTVCVNYGKTLLDTGLTRGQVLFDLHPADTPSVADVAQEIRRALQAPVDSPRLRELVGAGKRVVLIGDDLTRLTPCEQIVPLLLDELNAGGVPDKATVLVIALGTHRPMTEQEIRAKYGPGVVDRVQVVNHNCLDKRDLVFCGTTSRGTDIWVNRIVLEADVRIGVGNVVPHYPTGWSGGAKIVLPGVAGEHTTAQMHFLGASGHRLGEVLTPCREEMEDFAASIGLDFVLNVVLNRTGELVRAVAGHFVAAQREGVEWAKGVYGASFSQMADITISSTNPVDFDFWQAKKGLFSGVLCTKRGGEIILVSPCYEGVSATHPETVELAQLDDDELWRLAREEGGGYDPLSICAALYRNDVRRHCRVTVASEGVTQETAHKMGFTHIEPTGLSGYLDRRLAANRSLKVGILRNSAETLPIHKS